MKTIYTILVISGISLGMVSCGGFLDKYPTDSVAASKALVTLYDAGVAANGLYTDLKYYTLYGRYFVEMGDMRADNLYPRTLNGTSSTIYTLDYESEANTYFSLWNAYYTTIMKANTLIQNIETLEVTSDSDIATKNDYLGQAYAVRALCYFDIARLYGYPYLYDNGASLGAVPILTPVAPSESRVPRETVAQTYSRILDDLTNALGLLSKEKNLGHFNYWAAKLLQARVFLYKGDYPNAYSAAKEVIADSGPASASESFLPWNIWRTGEKKEMTSPFWNFWFPRREISIMMEGSSPYTITCGSMIRMQAQVLSRQKNGEICLPIRLTMYAHK